MKPIRSAYALSVCLLLMAAGAAAQRSGPMPSLLYYNAETRFPIWVAASQVLGENGRVRVDRFGAEAAALLQRRLEEPVGVDCVRFAPVHINAAGAPPRGTLDEAAAHSLTKVLVRITNKDYGFYSGADNPGQLLEAVPVRAFGATLANRPYYFFIPAGEFRVGDSIVCSSGEGYAEAPEIGAEVFLFIPGRPQGIDRNLLMVYGPGDIVPVARNGGLILPRHWNADVIAKSAAPSKQELIERLDRIARQEVKP